MLGPDTDSVAEGDSCALESQDAQSTTSKTPQHRALKTHFPICLILSCLPVCQLYAQRGTFLLTGRYDP